MYSNLTINELIAAFVLNPSTARRGYDTPKKKGRQTMETEILIGAFELGDEVYINNPGGIDDGLIGAVDEIDGDWYRVRIDKDDGGSWWNESELESAAAKAYYYGEINGR